MCRGSTPRFFRTVLPQSSSNARSSTFAFRVYGRSPAARTASLQLRNHCNTKNAEIPDREVNSARDGARPSFFATAAMEFKICFLSGICGVVVAGPLDPFWSVLRCSVVWTAAACQFPSLASVALTPMAKPPEVSGDLRVPPNRNVWLSGNGIGGALCLKMKKRERNLPPSKRTFLQRLLYANLCSSVHQNFQR